MEPIAGKVESSLSAESRKPSRVMNRAIEYIKSSSVSGRSQPGALKLSVVELENLLEMAALTTNRVTLATPRA